MYLLHDVHKFQSTDSQLASDREGKMFPPEGSQDVITCIALTHEFLIYGTEVCLYIRTMVYIYIYIIYYNEQLTSTSCKCICITGLFLPWNYFLLVAVWQFSLFLPWRLAYGQWVQTCHWWENSCHHFILIQSVHLCLPWIGIAKIYSDPAGTRLILVDEKSDAFVYNPVCNSTVIIHTYTCICNYDYCWINIVMYYRSTTVWWSCLIIPLGQMVYCGTSGL